MGSERAGNDRRMVWKNRTGVAGRDTSALTHRVVGRAGDNFPNDKLESWRTAPWRRLSFDKGQNPDTAEWTPDWC